jgi:hypothetical protein
LIQKSKPELSLIKKSIDNALTSDYSSIMPTQEQLTTIESHYTQLMAFENGKQLIRKRLLQKNNCCCGIFKKYGPKDFYRSPSLILLEQSWEKGVPSQKVIQVEKVRYDKKVLVIYNPNSGRRLNVRV